MRSKEYGAAQGAVVVAAKREPGQLVNKKMTRITTEIAGGRNKEKEMVALGSTTMVTDRILTDARSRASSASSKMEVIEAINEALSHADVPLGHVSLEDYKRLVTAATRASRAAGRSAPRTA